MDVLLFQGKRYQVAAIRCYWHRRSGKLTGNVVIAIDDPQLGSGYTRPFIHMLLDKDTAADLSIKLADMLEPD